MLPKIIIVHPELKRGGGSEARALWLAKALQGVGRVSLLSRGDINLDHLNAAYGTDLRSGDVEVISVPRPRLLRSRFDALRAALLARYLSRRRDQFDILISAYNVMDFGRRGIQFIADFSFDDELRRRLHPSVGGMQAGLYKKTIFRSAYLSICRAVSGTRQRNWMRNATVANSKWSRKILRERFGLECEVIYPPVTNIFPDIPWERREDGFVVLGRISPEKQVERVISILGMVRAKGHDVHLHLVGRPDHSQYGKMIGALCRQHSDWVSLEGLMLGEAKNSFLALHRYGISACQNEAFGIAVAEMAKAGCIVWVPRGGGQVEIVEQEGLIYDSDHDAAEKIIRVLESDDLRRRYLAALKTQSRRFSEDRFIAESRALVKGFLDGRL